MAKVIYDEAPLLVNLPDLIQEGNTIKRKGMLVEQSYSPVFKYVKITFDIVPYSDAGERLDLVENSIFQARRITFSADNRFLVDTAEGHEGEVLCPIEEEMLTAVVDGVETASLNPLLDDKTYMPDYDFWDSIAHTQSVILTDAIGLAIVRAGV